MIRVVLADDQTLMRSGLRGLLALAPDMEVVGEAADGEAAIALIRDLAPDVALVDVRMPRADGIAVLERLAPPPPTILLTTFDDDEALIRGMRAGARGFLLKDISLEQLLDAVRRVAAGETLIRPAVTAHVQRGIDRLKPDFDRIERPEPLTKREREVLRMMAGGHNNREIAEALRTSEGTIKNHASNIFAKLGVRDRTRAVLRGLQLGII
ncbi:MAG: response regulator transcription factor [Deltaproteobacteria bacterium]|nr:response regulator transcription factor [Deltaproteobacteria bacterium]